MARPLSEEKRAAIFDAAAKLVATIGTGAPTARIAKDAGVAEGTLFTYFSSKDDLLNQLFLRIEEELAGSLLDSMPTTGGSQQKIAAVWNRYIDWGASRPVARMALRQLKVSDRITEQSRQGGQKLFRDIDAVLDENLAVHAGPAWSRGYVLTIFDGLAEITQELIAREPNRHEHYREVGFTVFWNGIRA